MTLRGKKEHSFSTKNISIVVVYGYDKKGRELMKTLIKDNLYGVIASTLFIVLLVCSTLAANPSGLDATRDGFFRKIATGAPGWINPVSWKGQDWFIFDASFLFVVIIAIIFLVWKQVRIDKTQKG